MLGVIEKHPVVLPFGKERECNIYKHIIWRKRLLLEYEKTESDKYILRKYLEEGQCIVILVETTDGEKRSVNRCFALLGDDVPNVLFDEKTLLNEISKISETEQEQLLGLVLDCLTPYDTQGEERILVLAEKLLDIYKHKKYDEVMEIIYNLQFAARKRELNEDEIKSLVLLKYSPNIYARCCACIY